MLSKYAEDLRSSGYHTGRLDLDGMPYRGPSPGLLREDEYLDSVETAYDAGSQLFDLSDEEQRDAYVKILDELANGKNRLLFKENKLVEQPDGTVKAFAYIEWVLPYKMAVDGRGLRPRSS